MEIDLATILIIVITIIVYSVVALVLVNSWPKKCEPGKTSSNIDPVQQNDINPRDCQSVWTHDWGDPERWTQYVIDVVANGIGGKNCWDKSSNNSVEVKEIFENSPDCQGAVGRILRFNYAQMAEELLNDDWNPDNVYGLVQPTAEQKALLISSCTDCDIELYIDSEDNRGVYNTKITDSDCLSASCAGGTCLSDAAKCWGHCHGECGVIDDSGEETRKWVLKTQPGLGGRQCSALPKVLNELSEQGDTFVDRRDCYPDACPGCCETRTGLANASCNQISGQGMVGESNSREVCEGTAYDMTTDGSGGNCQWSEVSGAENTLFGFDNVCRYRDVTTDNADALGVDGLAKSSLDLNCRWDPNDSQDGICLESRYVREDETVKPVIRAGAAECDNPNDMWGRFGDGSCDNSFDISNPKLDKIFAIEQSQWATIDETNARCGSATSKEGCRAISGDCFWLEPNSGKCTYVSPPDEVITPEHADNMQSMCERQHAANSLVQIAYIMNDGVCEYPSSGLRISLTSIPNYGTDGVDWNKANQADGNIGWLWTRFDRAGGSTRLAMEWLKKPAAAEMWNKILPDYIVQLGGKTITGSHPVVDGSTTDATSFIANHYYAYVPAFKVKPRTGITKTVAQGLADIKNALNSKDFKDEEGFKIVVSNLDDMTWEPVEGMVGYVKGANVPTPSGLNSTDGHFVDSKECMIEGSAMGWTRHSDGDHPVINGHIWTTKYPTYDINTLPNHPYNCSPYGALDPDDAAVVNATSVWREHGGPDEMINGVRKFSGFATSRKFSNIQPNILGGDDPTDENNMWRPYQSHLSKPLLNVFGMRCKRDGDVPTKCRSKNKELADITNECGTIEDQSLCNDRKNVLPRCSWTAFDETKTDEQIQTECNAKIVE